MAEKVNKPAGRHFSGACCNGVRTVDIAPSAIANRKNGASVRMELTT